MSRRKVGFPEKYVLKWEICDHPSVSAENGQFFCIYSNADGQQDHMISNPVSVTFCLLPFSGGSAVSAQATLWIRKASV